MGRIDSYPQDAILYIVNEPWIDWTPTLTNLTLGNGSVVAKYIRHGRAIHYRFRFTLGSTSAVGTNPKFSLPVALATGYVDALDVIGDANLLEVGVANRRGQIWTESGTARIVGYSTTGVAVQITATVPHTWKTADGIFCAGTYEGIS